MPRGFVSLADNVETRRGVICRESELDVHWETKGHLELCASAATVQIMSVKIISPTVRQAGELSQFVDDLRAFRHLEFFTFEIVG